MAIHQRPLTTTTTAAVINVARISSQRKGQFPRGDEPLPPPRASHVLLQLARNGAVAEAAAETAFGPNQPGRLVNGPAGYSRPKKPVPSTRRHMGGSDGPEAEDYAKGITHDAAALKRAHAAKSRARSPDQSSKSTANGLPLTDHVARRGRAGLSRYDRVGGGLASDSLNRVRHHAAKQVRKMVFPHGDCLAYPLVDGVARAPTGASLHVG
jgi:hypothetical protein